MLCIYDIHFLHLVDITEIDLTKDNIALSYKMDMENVS